MLENQKDRELDALLDSLLASYSAVEPRSGLESRIRARLQAHAAGPRRATMMVFAISAAALLAAAVLVSPWQTDVGRPKPSAKTLPARGTNSTMAAATTTALRPRNVEGHHRPRDSQSTTLALLQLAKATQSNGDSLPNTETLDNPPAPLETENPEQQKSAGSIDIQNLDVDSIQIKELAPSKSDEKGNSR